MPDTNQRGKAHRHPRVVPKMKRFTDIDTWVQVKVTEKEFILPDNNTFGHLDLRSLVDEIGNEGED